MAEPNQLDLADFIDRRPVGTTQYLVIVLCALVVLFDGMDTQMIGYLGPALTAEWAIPPDQLGAVFSASLVGLMVGLFVIGTASDRLGRRRSILLSVALFSVFTLLAATARGTGDLVIFRFLAGIGLGGAMPNALALTGEYCPRRLRATLVILMFCGFSLGAIVGGVVAASLLSAFGWRMVFVVGGLLPLLLLPVLFFKLPESLHFLARQPRAGARLRATLGQIDPGLRLDDIVVASGGRDGQGVAVARLFSAGRAPGTVMLWVVFFMNLMVFYFLQNWLPSILTESGLSERSAILMTTLISFGGIVAGLISGPLMDRFNACNVLAGLYLCGTVLVATLGLVAPVWLALMTFGAGFCVSGAQKSVNALAVLFYPTEARSTGVGWALGIGRFGSILGPYLGGWLLALGWSTVNLFQLAALPLLLAALVIFAMGLRYRLGAGRRAEAA